MSYSHTYKGKLVFDVTIDYPASEHAGRKVVTIEEPIKIEIDVDTKPFDASVARCNAAVGGLTATVVATEAAQVEAKRKASRQIGDSIIRGFFNYVGAELSQKIKELASQCESMFGALLGYSESCLSKRDQMQDDYNRITKRYSKIFEDLDNETVSRIEILDRPTFSFADTAQKLVYRSSESDLLGMSTVVADENIRLETVLSCSHVKRQAGILIEKANDYLLGTYRLANSVRDMLEDRSGGEEIVLPVMFVESVSSSGAVETKVVSSDDEFAPAGDREKSKLITDFTSGRIDWRKMPETDMDKVMSYFNHDVRNDNMDERVMKTMLGLMNDNEIQTIKA